VVRPALKTRARLAADMAAGTLSHFPGQEVFTRAEVLDVLAVVHDKWADEVVNGPVGINERARARRSGFFWGIVFTACLFVLVFMVSR
jgi:hypothetical protein